MAFLLAVGRSGEISLTISVNDYASPKKLVHDQYGGRLADILDVKLA